DVLGDDHLAGLRHQALRELAHLQDGRVQVARDRARRVPQPRQLRHVLGEVAGALQVRGHAQRRDDDAQVGGDRLLPGQQGDGPRLQLVLQLVHLLVALDDVLGQLQVGVEDGRRGAPDRRPDQPGHLHQTVADRIQFLVVRVPHQGSSHACLRGSRSLGSYGVRGRVPRRAAGGAHAVPGVVRTPRSHGAAVTRPVPPPDVNRPWLRGDLWATSVRGRLPTAGGTARSMPNLEAWTWTRRSPQRLRSPVCSPVSSPCWRSAGASANSAAPREARCTPNRCCRAAWTPCCPCCAPPPSCSTRPTRWSRPAPPRTPWGWCGAGSWPWNRCCGWPATPGATARYARSSWTCPGAVRGAVRRSRSPRGWRRSGPGWCCCSSRTSPRPAASRRCGATSSPTSAMSRRPPPAPSRCWRRPSWTPPTTPRPSSASPGACRPRPPGCPAWSRS